MDSTVPDVRPRFIELCSGAGGMTLGFMRAGWECVLGLDVDNDACDTFCRNIGAPAIRASVHDISFHSPVDAIVAGFPCFAAGTLIITRDKGMTPIEDVRTGDEVLTHRSRWRKVTATMRREDAEIREVKVGGIPILTTDEHPFLTSTKTSEMQGAISSTGKRYPTRKLSPPDWLEAHSIDPKIHRAVQVLPNIDETVDSHSVEFWWVIGNYLAEGWIRRRSDRPSGYGGIILSCNPSQVDEVLVRLSAAGYHGCVSKERTAVKIIISNVELAVFVCSHFGEGASNKSIPGWVFELPVDKAAALLEGYMFGDGCLGIRGKSAGEKAGDFRRGISVSKKLALSLGLLSQRAFGVVASSYVTKRPSNHIIEGRSVNQKDTWQFVIPEHNRTNVMLDDKFGLRLIRSNTKTGERKPVFNLSVEEDESYTADGIVVHNCQAHSMSGKRLGLADPRGEVVYGVLRIAGEMRPRTLVFENVPGLITSPDADGERGGALLYIIREMMALGYTVSYDVLDANDHGIGQRRRRLFIVGSLDNRMWIRPTPDAIRRVVFDELFDLLDGDVDLPNHEMMKHKPETERKLAMLRPGESLYENFSESWKRLALDEPAPTQKENHGALSIHPLEPRCITAREMARLQGFPDDFEFFGPKSSIIKQIGNAVPVPLATAVARSIIPMLT